jgi:hypothetical protein
MLQQARFLLLTLLMACFLPTSAFAIAKERLVLMPLRLSDEDEGLKSAMETALSEGLQQTYTVFSGDKVQQKTKEIFDNESKFAITECDETKCMQDIAIAFQSELIAIANVTKRDNGYFLALSIQNIFDNKVVYSQSVALEQSNSFEVINKLKELSNTNTKPIAILITSVSFENEIWEEAKRGNTLEEYQIYLNKYPQGEFALLAKKNIANIREVKIKVEEEQLWNSAKINDNESNYEIYLQRFPSGKFAPWAKEKLKSLKHEQEEKAKIVVTTPLNKPKSSNGVWIDKRSNVMWQDDSYAKELKLNWYKAGEYCKKLSLGGFSNWRLPSYDELMKIVDYSKAFPAVKSEINNVSSKSYWTSTSAVKNSLYARTVDFATGGDVIAHKPEETHTRCIREIK